MDSEANSPKEPKKLPEKETKMESKPEEQPRGLESLKAAEEKRVVKVQKVARSGLVSVSETLDRAMQQLQESLEDGDTGGKNCVLIGIVVIDLIKILNILLIEEKLSLLSIPIVC